MIDLNPNDDNGKTISKIKFFSKKNNIKENSHSKNNYKKMESLLLKLQIFFLILFGFLVIRRISSSEQFELYLHYYAGMIFSFAGFFIGLYEKGLGLIFLVSHGLSGLGLMLEKNVYDAIKSPIMADNPTNIIIYLIIATIILIISLILVVTHNLNDSFKKKDYIINKIFFLISILIIIIMILPFV